MADKDFKITSIEDINKPGAKPAIGVSADPFAKPIYQYDETGRITSKRDFGGSGISKAQRERATDPEKARVGDYYYDLNGNLNVVPNSPTDIFNKYKITSDTSLYEKPTRDTGGIVETMLGPILGTAGGAVGAGIGAKVAGATGAVVGSPAGLLSFLAIGGVLSAQQAGAREKAYKDALKDWQKSQEKAVWKVAGNLSTDENGRISFTPDPSKAITMNTAFAGSEIQKAFNKETNVYFGDDGRLKVEVNPIFAATDQYSQMVDLIKKGYSGLTKDTENVDQYVGEIKDYITNANNQFKFREQSLYSYKTQIPDAPDNVIEDAYTNEIGAYMSESDGADYDVRVYRDGEIKSETAQKVLEDFYKKDLGQRSDYMLDLFAKMDDPTVSPEDKTYILSEIKLLNAADANDQKYDNGQKDENGAVVKTTNKYFGMLDQESIISTLNNWSLVGGVSITDAINALDAITPWNMHISDQRGLQEDPAAASAARLISTATSAMTAFLAMQGLEHGVIRPLAAKIGESITSGVGGFLERLAARGGKLSELVGEMQLATGAAAEGGNLIAQWVQGARLASSPMVRALGFSMSELLYNATSDLAFDAAKQGIKALAGEEPTSEEFLEEFGVDLVMDLIMQYGPAGLAQTQSALDNFRLEAVYAPYKEGLEYAQQQFDTAELEYNAVKQEVAEMKKGTKAYKEREAELSAKQQEYENAKANYEKLRGDVDTAIKEAMPSMSEELGAALAGKLSELEQNNIVMWLRRKFTDEKAGLSVLAEQAYNKTKDVYLYAAAVNKFQSIQAGIKEVSTKMLSMDAYAKGTSEAYRGFTDAVQAAAPSAKFSKTQIEYLVAKAEYDTWTKYAADDADILAKVEEKYLPYINKVQGEEANQLNQVLESTKAFLKKVGESYIKSDAATKTQVQDIEKAALGVEYIPLWGKGAKSQRFGIFETPLTLRIGRDFNPDEPLYDVEGIRNPVESAAIYTHNVMNNIARNEMAAMLKDIASIDGVGVELVGEGAKDAKPEFDDLIEESRNNIAKSNAQMLMAEVTEEKYSSGLKKVLSSGDNDAAIRSIDKLIKDQGQLQRLVNLNNTETDAAKRANRLVRVTNLDARIKEQKVQVRADIDKRVRAAGDYFNKTYKPYGITVDIDDYLTSAKYTKMIDGKLNSLSTENLIALKDDIAKTVNQVAPYLSLKKIDQKVLNSEIKDLRTKTRERLDKEHPEYSAKKKYAIVGKTVENFRAQLAGDYGMVYDDPEISLEGAYKIPFISEGQDASFYIKGKLAREVAAEMTTKNVTDRRAISEFFKEAANIKRLLTTGLDPTRVLPNLVRDTLRNGVMSGGTDYWFFDNSPFGFTQMFTKMARAVGSTDEQIKEALDTLKATQEIVSGATYNEAINGRRTNTVKRLVESSSAVGDNRGVKFVWELAHDKKGLLSAPMNWAESLTRNRAAASAFMRAYLRGGEGLSYETRLNNAYEAGLNAGRENTMNFLRRGTFINEIASYVPYLSQRFSSIESAKIAFLKDPVGVSSRVMMFGAAYMMELSRVLADEKSRKNYYNLSEYDRENNIILSLGNGNLVTIPLDESMAALIYPWRRGLETLHNIDPQDFYMIMVNGFLELSPFDLSGFTEGDSFNFGRGLEKLGGQVLPTLVQFAYTQASGRNMYYGSQVEVTADSLAEYGNYDPTPGDFTTIGKNSQLLRHIADALGIEQWRLQQGIADLGGNVGQYVVNWLDKIAGAPEDAQGGKDFMDATFKSFTGMDSTQVQYAFNDGINELTAEKEKLKGKLGNLNKQISLASGSRLAELQEEYRGIKQDFAMKVGSFVDKYINAYEIAGGLTKDQANKIWYLLNFADDDSLAMANSVESYYRDLAKKQANNDATNFSAGILDKYYDQTKNVYKDSSGKWHYYSPYGEQAFFNTVQGRGMEYQIGLRNLIESDLNNLNAERSAAYDAREAAANAKNWDEYDKIGLRFDDKIIDVISPYIKRYGADNVLTNSAVLDYLEEWFFVPTSYMKSKYGKNISLAHNASKQRAFKRPYIKQLFGVDTGYTESNYISRPENLVRGEE